MKAVPFYANVRDNMHCFQASMRMILKYFLPDQEFSWEELESLSAKLEGKSTWPQQMLINLAEMNFDVTMVEGFDGPAFIKDGAAYLRRAFGTETAEWQIANSDIPQEQAIYARMLEHPAVHVENRIPQVEELQTYLQKGYLINCVVNSRRLNRATGYMGHSIIIYNIENDVILLHDPGPPAQQARQVSLTDFETAWADPNETAKNFIAIKLKGNPNVQR